jgi:hypothetical protein
MKDSTNAIARGQTAKAIAGWQQRERDRSDLPLPTEKLNNNDSRDLA